MNRMRLWLLALAVAAIALGGAAGWPDMLESGTSVAAQTQSIAGAFGPLAATERGQRWHLPGRG